MTDPPAARARRFLAPAAYVQGPGVLDAVAEHARPLRDADGTAYVLGGTTALDRTRDALVAGLEDLGLDVAAVAAGVDACTRDCIDAHSGRARDHGADVGVGVGGGTALDVVKAVGASADCEVVTVPTVASTDAPCSAVSIVYDDEGSVESPRFHARNPTLVLVDTGVLAAAPPRYLRYGIGDALATRFEAAAVARADGETDAGGAPSHAAGALAASTYDCLVADGADALAAAADGEATPAFERVVETVILRSGLGFESGGVAAAHALHNAAVEVGIRRPHGELVCFGVVAQLALEGRTATAGEVVDLCADLDLRVTLADLGVEDVPELARAAADRPLVANQPTAVTPALMADAIRDADELMGGGPTG